MLETPPGCPTPHSNPCIGISGPDGPSGGHGLISAAMKHEMGLTSERDEGSHSCDSELGPVCLTALPCEL